MLSPLTAISPVDGRYRKSVEALSDYFPEAALMRYRVRVEAEYLIALSGLGLRGFPAWNPAWNEMLDGLWKNFSEADANEIKTLEATTNHDVKAVEYFIRRRLQSSGVHGLENWIHFGLTSQDINNTAIPLSLKEAAENVIFPSWEQLIQSLEKLAEDWKEVPMLARTHGQAASPTRLGKEINVFVFRLRRQMEQWKAIPWAAKFGGATGNFNAHIAAFPGTDWHHFATDFVNNRLGLRRSWPTTQIEPYDDLAAWFDAGRRMNMILIDMCRDFWTYISMDYFGQRLKAGEVGSSAMPHKVNPIDFENAEGNLGISSAMFGFFSEKLPVSRLQRDLTDSTVLRNIGVPLAHMLIALNALGRGLAKLQLREDVLRADLNRHWAVVAEAIQTVLRRENYPSPYEALRDFSRGKDLNETAIRNFIMGLDVTPEVREELLAFSPENYLGQ
jgi:adenylosuccinate lyase